MFASISRDVARYVSNYYITIIPFHLYETWHATYLQRLVIIRNMDISIVRIMIRIIRSLASDILLIHSFNLIFVYPHCRDVARYVSNYHTPIISFHLYETWHATYLRFIFVQFPIYNIIFNIICNTIHFLLITDNVIVITRLPRKMNVILSTIACNR